MPGHLASWCLRLLPLALATVAQAEVLLSPPATVAKERHGRCAGVPATAFQADGEQAWRLARERFLGLCRPRNHAETVQALQQAASLGHGCAVGALGLMQGMGWGTTRDLQQAHGLIRQSQALGCARAPYWAWRVETAENRSPSTRQDALALLEWGVRLQDGHALNAWGALHETLAQPDLARSLYEQAVAQGNATARQNLARLQRQQWRGPGRPTLEALQQRADGGDGQASYLLARRLHAGDGVAVHFGEAIQRYQQAARLGDAAARDMLALIRSSATSAQAFRQRMSALANVEIAADEINKARGITQPLEDEDPFDGL